jgi:hypothetical protein
MNKMVKKTITFSVLLLMLTLLFINSFNKNDQKSNFSDNFLTPIFSEEADQSFVSSIVDHSNLNSGIAVFEIKPLESDQTNYISFVVFNYTEENIVFPDQGFGFSLYWYSDVDKTWEEVSLSQFPDRTPKTLPPQLEDLDHNIQNTRLIFENDIETLPYKRVRLYISGIGQVSNSIYGSYVDLLINP